MNTATETNVELLAHKPYAAALAKLTETVKARDKADAELERLRAGYPRAQTVTERAVALLSGGLLAPPQAEVGYEEFEAANDDLAVLNEACRLCQEHVAEQRKAAVRAALTARLPKHKQLVGAVAEALQAAVDAIDIERAFFAECEKLSGGNSAPIQGIQPQQQAVLRLRHIAGEFPTLSENYVNG